MGLEVGGDGLGRALPAGEQRLSPRLQGLHISTQNLHTLSASLHTFHIGRLKPELPKRPPGHRDN